MNEQGLLESYADFDRLNADRVRPLVKILVGYVRRGFLFKTGILTPIHLGRAVESVATKEGVTAESDLRWLHENCFGDDDVPDGLSEYNRRIGFFTGTYWAWRNYARLGDPEYFGSFGFRKLLDAKCLENLTDYEVVVPTPSRFGGSLKRQMLEYHGEASYRIMVESVAAVRPEDRDGLLEYMEGDSGYFHELYILRKDQFFRFCDWMCPLVRHMLAAYPEFFGVERASAVASARQRVLLGEYLGGDGTAEARGGGGVESRDIAFVVERLTGYFLHKLVFRERRPAKIIRYENLVIGDAERRQMLAKMRGTAISSLRAAMKGR